MTETRHLLSTEKAGWGELAALSPVLEAVGFGCLLPMPVCNTHWHVEVQLDTKGFSFLLQHSLPA